MSESAIVAIAFFAFLTIVGGIYFITDYLETKYHKPGKRKEKPTWQSRITIKKP
jgi:hypothetical protein